MAMKEDKEQELILQKEREQKKLRKKLKRKDDDSQNSDSNDDDDWLCDQIASSKIGSSYLIIIHWNIVYDWKHFLEKIKEFRWN